MHLQCFERLYPCACVYTAAQAQLADAQTQAQAATRSAADLAAQLAKASKSQTHSTVSAPVIGAARLTKSESVNSEKPLHTSVSDLPEVVVQTLRMELAQVRRRCFVFHIIEHDAQQAGYEGAWQARVQALRMELAQAGADVMNMGEHSAGMCVVTR